MNDAREQKPLNEIREKNSEYFTSEGYVRMQERKSFNAIGGGLIFQFVLSNIIALVLMFVFGGVAAFVSPDSNNAVAQEWFMPLTYCITFLFANTIPFIISAKKVNISIPSLFKGDKLKISTIVGCVAVCLGVNGLSGIVVNVLTMILQALGLPMKTPDFGIGTSLVGNILLVTAICVLAPITEEFIFRGVLLKFFCRKSEKFGIIFSALLFSLVHGNIQQSVGAFFIGLVFGYVAVKTKSIVIPIIGHMVNNFIAIVATFAMDDMNYALSAACSLILIGCGIYTIIYLLKQSKIRTQKNLIYPQQPIRHNGWLLAGTSWTLILSSAIYVVTLVLMTFGILSIS